MEFDIKTSFYTFLEATFLLHQFTSQELYVPRTVIAQHIQDLLVKQHGDCALQMQTPKLIMQTPKLIMQTPKRTMQPHKRIMQMPKLIMQILKMIMQTPKLIMQMQTPKTIIKYSIFFHY